MRPRFFHLLLALTRTQLKLQHEGSILGVAWHVLGPVLMCSVLYGVFASRLGGEIEHYGLYLLLGIIVWNVFGTGAGAALRSLRVHGGLLRSLPVSRSAIIGSAVAVIVVSHCIEVLVYLVFSLYQGVVPTVGGLLIYWCVLGLLVLFTFGAGMVLAPVYVLVRDIEKIWVFVVRIGWFATPIFYALPHEGLLTRINQWNPLFHAVTLARSALIGGSISSHSFLILSSWMVAALVVGSVVLRCLAPRLPEYV